MDKRLYKRRREYVGNVLKKEREWLKIDQEDFAQMLGVRQELISKIEVGTRRIDIIELIDYCEMLHLSLPELAVKIESRLLAHRAIKRPNKKNQNESNIIKKIRVDVSWRDNSFSASFGENIPGADCLNAETFIELQIEIQETFDSHIERLFDDVDKIPQWIVSKEYEFEYRFLDVTSLLKACGPYLSLAAISRVTGINKDLLSQYANGLKKAGARQMIRIVEGIQEIGKELMAVVI